MKRALLTLVLIAVALQAAAQAQDRQGAGLAADSGGPYHGAAGSVVHLDASGSEGNITGYYWDYGDGSAGSGKTTEHIYKKEGAYRIILKVTDAEGRIDYSPTGAFIKPAEILIDLAADPLKDIYDYGDVLSGIEARVSYSNGSHVTGATMTGSLSGNERIPLAFRETGDGKYRSDQSYPVVKGMDKFINVTVEAKSLDGKTATATKKIPIRPVSSDDPNDRASVFLTVNSPSGNSFAYGQKISYRISFERVNLNDRRSMDEGSVYMYEGWTDNAFAMTRSGTDYVLDYRIPPANNPLQYIIYGSGKQDGKTYNAMSAESFKASNDLTVEITAPDNGSYAPDVKEIRLKVSYPDRSIVPEENLRALIGKDSVDFRRSGNLYTAGYSIPANQSRLDIWVYDGKGNGGGAKAQLSDTKPAAANETGMQPLQIIYTLAPLVGLLIVLFLAYRFIEGRRSYRKNLSKEYDETLQKIESLKAVTNNVMNEYYTRKITEEEARSRVLDCEKDLVIERRKLKDLMQKLGMDPGVNPEKSAADSGAEKSKEGEKE